MTKGSGPPASLTPSQIEEVVRFRRAGKTYKEIAIILRCTPWQVLHYWRISPHFKPRFIRRPNGSKSRKQKHLPLEESSRLSPGLASYHEQRCQEIANQQTRAAAAMLSKEIAKAKAEAGPLMAERKLYKPGALEW